MQPAGEWHRHKAKCVLNAGSMSAEYECATLNDNLHPQHDIATGHCRVGYSSALQPSPGLVIPIQATSDGVRFLEERKPGMTALLDRTVKEAISQIKVPPTSWALLPFDSHLHPAPLGAHCE